MTRINLVPPQELMDQHLFAEFREIKMIPPSLQRSINSRGVEGVLQIIPNEFTLNKGHVTFFYDKGVYLRKRYKLLKKELRKRGINYNRESVFDPNGIMEADCWSNNYIPTIRALKIIRKRIRLRIAEKPTWYRYYGTPITE